MNTTQLWLTSVIVAGLGLGAGAGFAYRDKAAKPPGANADFVVPHADETIAIDGETDDRGWAKMAHSGPFHVGVTVARPYSDARFVHRDGQLFIMLYAADEDLRTDGTDAFEVRFATASGERRIVVTPKGLAGDAPVRAAVDLDGTLDDPSDQDEEWVAEVAVPLYWLGLAETRGARTHVTIIRRDTLRGKTERVVGQWNATLVLGD